MPTDNFKSKLAWPPAPVSLSNPVKNDFPVHLKNVDLLQEPKNVRLSNALFYSILKGRLQKTKFLLDQGINVNARNDHGFSPLVAALHIDKLSLRRKLFRMLLQHGANPLGRDVPNNRDVLSWAALLGRSEEVQILLDDFGGDIHLTDLDKHGFSALHYATHSNSLDTVRSLIAIYNKYNISVDIQDRQGMTPYAHARRLGHSEVAEVLRKEGNASTGHADNINFKSPREWSQIGRFERQLDEYQLTKKEMDRARLLGRINKAKALRDLTLQNVVPTLALFQDQVSSSLKSDASSDSAEKKGRQINGFDFLSSRDNKTKDSDRQVKSVCAFPSNRFKPKKEYADKYSPMPLDMSFDDNDAQSVKTRFSNKAALNLLAMTSDKGKVVARFHSSEVDKSKSSQYHGDNVNNFLNILSDQTSSSYRQSVTVPPPRAPTPPVLKRKKNKSKVSSLAIIMGRQRSGNKRRKQPNHSKINELRKNKKTKNKSKNFLLPDIKINDRAV